VAPGFRDYSVVGPGCGLKRINASGPYIQGRVILAHVLHQKHQANSSQQLHHFHYRLTIAIPRVLIRRLSQRKCSQHSQPSRRKTTAITSKIHRAGLQRPHSRLSPHLGYVYTTVGISRVCDNPSKVGSITESCHSEDVEWPPNSGVVPTKNVGGRHLYCRHVEMLSLAYTMRGGYGFGSFLAFSSQLSGHN
jgi:hypothetical protein